MSERPGKTPEEIFAEQRRLAEEARKLLGVQPKTIVGEGPPQPEAEELPKTEEELRLKFSAYRSELEAGDAWKATANIAPEERDSWLLDQYFAYLQHHSGALGLPQDERDTAVRTILEEEGFAFAGGGERKERPEGVPLDPEARFNGARDAFVKAEQNWEKYLGATGTIRGWFGGKAAAREEYDRAREQYAEARAERVGAELNVFLQEETKLADERIRTATEKKGVWEKVSNLWKWMGDQNLEKLGWKPQSRLGRMVARGANLRTAVGLGLMGLSVAAGPASFVAFGALGVRRGMAGVGATMFSSEWLGRRAEVSRTTASDKELEAMDLEKAEARLGDMVIGLRMQGKLASESEDYRKLFSRYETLLGEEYQHLGNDAEYLKGASSATLEGFYHSQEKFKRGQDIRRGLSIAAGVGAAIGVAPLLKYLYGATEVVPGGPPAQAPTGLAPEVGEMEVPIPEELLQQPAEVGEMEVPIPEELLAQQGVEAAPALGEEVMETQETYEALRQAEIASIQEQVENLQAQLAKIQDGLAAQEAAGAATAAEAFPEARLPAAFELTVQYGEGHLHEIRKAVAEYIALSGDPKLQELTKAQRLWVEETLLRKSEIKAALPSEWKVGTKVSLPSHIIGSVLNEAEGQSPEKIALLEKNLAQPLPSGEPSFVDRVKWPRYEVGVLQDGSVHKPWEWDEGIRREVPVAERLTGGFVKPSAVVEIVEAPRFAPAWEDRWEVAGFDEEGARLEELVLGGDGDKAAALRDVDPELSQRIFEEDQDFAATREATLEVAAERVGQTISRLDPEEYRAIKDLKVSEALRKTFWGNTEENTWPSTRDPNHLDLSRKGKLRDAIAYVLGNLPEEERGRAAGLTISQFIREYYLTSRS